MLRDGLTLEIYKQYYHHLKDPLVFGLNFLKSYSESLELILGMRKDEFRAMLFFIYL